MAIAGPLPGPEHFKLVADALVDGNVVPFLGAGVNLWNRDEQPQPVRGDQARLPSGRELARELAPADWPAEELDLLRVSQYIDVMQGSGPLYRKLRRVFNRDFPITPLHDLLARLPATLAAASPENPAPLIVTTNYDYVLERGLQAVRQDFDQITYLADGDDSGHFIHRRWRKAAPDQPPQPQPGTVIRLPNEYQDADLAASRYPVILKIHGAVDTVAESGDSYVITEDHYIDYLARTDTANFLPAVLTEKLRNSHILFLGYGLRDWNLRVILRRLWGRRQLTWTSWAIQHKYDELDRRFWARRDVELIAARLEHYVEELEQELVASVARAGTRP